MPRKTGIAVVSNAIGAQKEEAEGLLVSVARAVGSTLGAAAGKAGEAAEDLMTLSQAAQKRALGAARTARKQANKTVLELVGGSKKSGKKPRARKRQAKKSSGRSK